jgi:aspartyl-tRNA(Asn)/glutamyl-tRNA(Gln) amidotransferase subunit B
MTTMWPAVIGLEVHVQLATRSKLFSAAPNRSGEPPNQDVDPVVLGMPGVLPVINREAVTLAMRLGHALGCTIDRSSRFARKHYFYPDLPKGYQTSQFEAPICQGGALTCEVEGVVRTFQLERIHLEEDAGKTVHDGLRGWSAVDCNRAGVPLVEVVSRPELRSAQDAVAYLKALHRLVVALGVSEGNLEQGNFRCDANVSVRPNLEAPFGTRVELKNINSFRFVARAINHEIERQTRLCLEGGEVLQETRLWDDAHGVTRAMRTKEEAHDYRYFPCPDLMPVIIDDAWYADVLASMPELPRDRKARFMGEMGVSEEAADFLTQSTAMADYFEQVVHALEKATPLHAAHWIQGELMAVLNQLGCDVGASPVSASAMAELLELVAGGTLSSKMAKSCFGAMCRDAVTPSDWVAEHGGQITDTGAIDAIVKEVLDAHPGEVGQYLSGKTKVVSYLVGQVMKATRGRANPVVANETLRRLIEERRS